MRKPFLLLAASAVLALSQGCVLIRVPVAGRPMSRGEALSAGEGYCVSHGLHCDLQEAHLTGNGIWKVKYRATRGDARGHVHLEIHAGTGQILDVDEKLKEHGPKRDRDDDDDHDHDDDDDDDHGRGKGKGKGKD